MLKETQRTKLNIVETEKIRLNSWYVENKLFIKSILITISLCLIIYSSFKLAKYIIRSGWLTNFSKARIAYLESYEKELSQNSNTLKSQFQQNPKNPNKNSDNNLDNNLNNNINNNNNNNNNNILDSKKKS
jgi:hypothetical protein